MLRKSLSILIALTFAVSLAAAADNPISPSTLSAAQIVDKNVAARGGLQAWRGVQALTYTGNLGVGGNQRQPLPVTVPGRKVNPLSLTPSRRAEEVQLPFVMELARPRKLRFELQFRGQTALQVFDGANGWKLRPYLNRLEVEPYTPEEMNVASMQADLDGYLVDYATKGTKVELVGMDKVEDRNTYKVKLTMKDGKSLQLWIDAQTFLEAKVEGTPRRLDGVYHPVEIYYRDYRPVNGLQIPFLLETKVLPVNKTATGYRDTPVPVEKIVVEKVVVNPKLDPSAFSKPQVAAAATNTK
jgi:hypothetical protein